MASTTGRSGVRSRATAGRGAAVISRNSMCRRMVSACRAMRGADTSACNWLRTAFDAIVERTHPKNRLLPVDALLQFANDPREVGRARHVRHYIDKDGAARSPDPRCFGSGHYARALESGRRLCPVVFHPVFLGLGLALSRHGRRSPHQHEERQPDETVP